MIGDGGSLVAKSLLTLVRILESVVISFSIIYN